MTIEVQNLWWVKHTMTSAWKFNLSEFYQLILNNFIAFLIDVMLHKLIPLHFIGCFLKLKSILLTSIIQHPKTSIALHKHNKNILTVYTRFVQNCRKYAYKFWKDKVLFKIESYFFTFHSRYEWNNRRAHFRMATNAIQCARRAFHSYLEWNIKNQLSNLIINFFCYWSFLLK